LTRRINGTNSSLMVGTMARVSVAYPSLSRSEVVERQREGRIRSEGKLPISRMILFGSYARGRYTAGRDVVVVYGGSERYDAYKVVMNEVRVPRLEPRVYIICR